MRDIFRNLSVTVASIFADMYETVTFNQTQFGAYDPASGTSRDSVASFDVPVIFSTFQANQKALSDLTPGQAKCSFPALNQEYVPAPLDTMMRNNDANDVYEVVDAKTDASNATWLLILKKR